MTMCSRRLILIPDTCPHLFCSDSDAILYTSEVIKGWSDIQRKNRRAIRFRWCRIIVDDVANFLPTLRPADDPIVAVKRWFITAQITKALKQNDRTVR
jgi:hypothetical protein